jgi:tetratricopeptide (TPR) repeat protein
VRNGGVSPALFANQNVPGRSEAKFQLAFSVALGLDFSAMPEKGLNDIPREVRPLFTKGNDALSRENFDYAIDLFSQVLSRAPEVFEVRKALRKAQQGKAAAGGGGFFKKVFSSAGSAPQVAKAQMALSKNPTEALAIAEQVLNSDANNGTAHKIIVQAAEALDMPQTAVLSLDFLWRQHPKDKDINIQFAAALGKIGEVKLAERILIDLRAMLPNDPDVHQALKNSSATRTLGEGGYQEISKGDGSYRQILRNEEEAKGLEQENRVQKTENTSERLIGEYEARLKSEPNNPKLMRSLAELYTQKKQFDKALGWYDRLKATEMGADASLDQAITQVKVRKLDLELEQLDPTAPDFPERTAALQTEKLAFRLSECQKRVEKYPTDLAFRFDLGTLYLQSGKIGEAISEFQKAQSYPNKRIAAMAGLAQCFAKRKMNDLAAKTLQNAIKEKLVFDDEKKDLIYQLGCVFEAMEKKEDAVEQFKLIYESDIGYKDVAAKVDAYYAGQ